MSSFPVLDSILSPVPLALLFQERYGLSRSTTCKVFRTGINHTYLVSDNEKQYVFRVYSFAWRTETEIREELRLLRLLKAHNISASYPLQDRLGQDIQKIEAPEGERYAVLFTYAAGDKIRQLSEAHCHRIGKLMAQFHKVSLHQSAARISYDASTLTQLPYQYTRQHFPASLEEMEFVRKASEHITKVFEQAESVPLRSGIVHLDLWYDNMHIDEDAKITVFDFDFCGNGWLLLDIAYWVMQLFHTEPDQDQFALKLKRFYQGYEEVSPIHDEEKKLLPLAGLAIWIFYLGVQSQRFDNWSNIFLTKNYLKFYIGRAKAWLAYHHVDISSAAMP